MVEWLRHCIARNGRTSLRSPWIIAALIAMTLLVPAESRAFSCGNRIVSVGNSEAEVVMKCGDPAWKESREEEILEHPGDGTKRRTVVVIDEWTYNFGPQSFLRILEFRNGTLADIRTAGYGYSDTGSTSAGCDEHAFRKGETKYEVLMRCGEPVWKEQHTEEVSERLYDSSKRRTNILVEQWTYNLGPNKLMRIIIFRNGVLSDIQTGDYGK